MVYDDQRTTRPAVPDDVRSSVEHCDRGGNLSRRTPADLVGWCAIMSDSRFRVLGGHGVGILLELACRARYQIEVRGIENFTRSPSTLVVFNHRRDADTPIIANLLWGHRLSTRPGMFPHFIAREDLFRAGFLANYLAAWPAPVRALLAPLNVTPFLWALHAYPMRRIAERTLREVLEDVLRIFGDLPVDQVLKDDWLQRFAQLARSGEPPTSVRQLLQPKFRHILTEGYGLTKLTGNRFRALKPYERVTIESQLQQFVELLERGESLQMAPEGAVSRDGRFARIRAGLHVLVNRPNTTVRVLPVGITYDFMTCGRPWVFLNVGQEMTELRGLKPSEASARVAEAILAQSTITASQLASQLLLSVESRGGGTITWAQVLDCVATGAREWTDSGFYVDHRLMNEEERDARMAEYVEYCRRSGELIPQGDGRYWVAPWAEQAVPSWADPEGAINYINNELTSVTALFRSA